jgi:hypothetical protein
VGVGVGVPQCGNGTGHQPESDNQDTSLFVLQRLRERPPSRPLPASARGDSALAAASGLAPLTLC